MNRFDIWNEKLKEEDIWEFKTNPWQRVRFDDVVSFLPKDANSILDLGCMEGEMTSLLPYPQEKITGVDLSSLALERARKKLPNATFKVLDLDVEPLPQTFDLIVCAEILYYLTDQQKCMGRILGMLNPGGTLVLEQVLNSNIDNRIIADTYHQPYSENSSLAKTIIFRRYGKNLSESYEIAVFRKI